MGFQHFEYLRDLGYGTRPTEFDKSLTDFAAMRGPEMPFPDDEYEMEMGTGHFTTDGGAKNNLLWRRRQTAHADLATAAWGRGHYP